MDQSVFPGAVGPRRNIMGFLLSFKDF